MSRNVVGVPYSNPTRYVGPGTNLIPVTKVARAPTTNDANYPVGQFWLVGDNPSTGTVGDLWYLCYFLAGAPQWCQVAIGAGAPGIDFLRDQVDAQAEPDASGNVDIDGVVVANAANPSGIPVESVAGTNKIDLQVQVAAARTGAPGDTNDAGLCSFDDTAFSVDADGYVTLVGGAGPAVDTINVDTNTGPGTDPVVPDGSGIITVAGNTVANATNTEPVYTHSRAANAYNIEVQVATEIASAPGDKLDAGLASFDSNSFSVDADGFVTLTGTADPGIAWMSSPTGAFRNIGISYSAGTFTVHGYDGTALSASNPAQIVMADDANPGLLKMYEVTANQSFEDAAGTSDIIGNRLGFDTAAAITVDVPVYLYAASDGTSVTFGLSRVPNLTVAPATANLGSPASATADVQASLFLLEDVTLANYETKPVALIASFRMQMSATFDWTVQPLDSIDGVGRYNESRIFTVPVTQFGANTGTYCIPNGGTAAAWTTNDYFYTLSANGRCELKMYLNGDPGTDGSGAVSARFTTPFIFQGTRQQFPVRWKVGAGVYQTGMTAMAAGSNFFAFTGLSTGAEVTWAAFVNGDRRFEVYGTYTVKNS